jgi:hypothetical protein
LENVRAFRLASSKVQTQKKALTPALFTEDRQPLAGTYLAVPRTSSENRPYVPIAYLESTVVAANDIQMVPGAGLYEFGVLQSKMHLSWTATVTGRLESRIRYSSKVVYNNYPWPEPTPEQRAKVETCAAAVLAAREPHLPPRGMSTLADLYDPLTMPPALSKAHADLDRAVERCYRPEPFRSDRERVEHLFRLYEQLTAPLLPASPRSRSPRSQPAATRSSPRRRPRTPGLPEANQG